MTAAHHLRLLRLLAKQQRQPCWLLLQLQLLRQRRQSPRHLAACQAATAAFQRGAPAARRYAPPGRACRGWRAARLRRLHKGHVGGSVCWVLAPDMLSTAHSCCHNSQAWTLVQTS